jgi:hypothetical protein
MSPVREVMSKIMQHSRSSPEQQFEKELEIFRKESEAAAQYFCGFRTMHEVAGQDTNVVRYLNRRALLWNTVASALQTSALIALHRVFNSKSNHNLEAVVKVIETNATIFSK